MKFLLTKRKSSHSEPAPNHGLDGVEKMPRVCSCQAECQDGCSFDHQHFFKNEFHFKRQWKAAMTDAADPTEQSTDASMMSAADSELASYNSWGSASTVSQQEISSFSVSPKSVVVAPSSEERERDAFVRRAIRHLQCWMPGTVRAPEVISFEIARANTNIASCDLPGRNAFIPVHSSCPMLPIFDYCDIDAVAVALGASYFQRLLEKKPDMKAAAIESGWFVQTINESTGVIQTQMRAVYSKSHTGLLVIYATCIYIAAKFADRIKYKRLLSAILFSMLDSYVSEATVRQDGFFFGLAGRMIIIFLSIAGGRFRGQMFIQAGVEARSIARHSHAE